MATSGQPAVLPLSVPVTAQSTTPRCSAGTTSANGMLTAEAPMACMKSVMVLLKTRTFLPLRSDRPPILSRHQMTCGGLVPTPSILMLNSLPATRDMVGSHARQAARAVLMSSARPARSQPSKVASSPAILETSLEPKSTTPSLVMRMTWWPLTPITSMGANVAVTLPPDASGMALDQNGTSSMKDATVFLLRPTPVTWVFGRSAE